MTEPLLVADRLYRFFHAGEDETLALRGVTLSVSAGEIVAVTGPSGSGKSTLLSCLAGLDEPDGGHVQVAGQRLSRRPEAVRARIRASHIGMLFQSANLVGHLSVASNVALAQTFADRRQSPPVGDLLEQVGIAHRATHRPAQLSGGELARAGLAVALANGPTVILADEPTGELDSVTARRILTLLRLRAQDSAAVVLVTHSTDVAGYADRTIALRDGEAVA